ncbi:hypothetical protein MUN89_02310 [Halobacillus salinarum]|uniref:Uncharacterized protein n=1 Tax=Halobacillus salinarum TaxID=2932257 RepID=A0ABY4ELR7_9BACI|nr:hypothetical protein [Halobacillus salinarum]UOQ44808.1 hypothetical protein MUN89_02310 [Halobacillus salinarum]
MAEFIDYVNRAAVPKLEEYIDIKTGDTRQISQEVQDQLDYHAKNSTLIHLLYSALDHYFSKGQPSVSTDHPDIFKELSIIKGLLQQGAYIPAQSRKQGKPSRVTTTPQSLSMEEVEEVLEAFIG